VTDDHAPGNGELATDDHAPGDGEPATDGGHTRGDVPSASNGLLDRFSVVFGRRFLVGVLAVTLSARCF
jgi:hypothetical protein